MPIFRKPVTTQQYIFVHGALRFLLFGLACVLSVEFSSDVIERIFADHAALRGDARIYELYRSKGISVVVKANADEFGYLLLTVVTPQAFTPTLDQMAQMARAQAWEIQKEIRDRLAPNADLLTGLPLYKALEPAFQKETRVGGRTISLLMMDLKALKQVNNVYGSPVGDRVLQATAAHLRRVIPGRYPVFRYGGEEFAALLTDVGKCEALETAGRCHEAVASIRLPSSKENSRTNMDIWIGVATQTNPREFRPMLEDADIALTAAKKMARYENSSSDILHYQDISAERQRQYGRTP